jgi:hypothetical protein
VILRNFQQRRKKSSKPFFCSRASLLWRFLKFNVSYVMLTNLNVQSSLDENCCG